jgi:hypothetical protein
MIMTVKTKDQLKHSAYKHIVITISKNIKLYNTFSKKGKLILRNNNQILRLSVFKRTHSKMKRIIKFCSKQAAFGSD